MKSKKGFTLIEIGIVLFVIGILITVFLPTFTQGIKDRAVAKQMIKMSRELMQNVYLIAQSCNVPQIMVVKLGGE